jgi:hypothetical protein
MESFATNPDEDERCALCRSLNGDVRDLPLFMACYDCKIYKAKQERNIRQEIERELE